MLRVEVAHRQSSLLLPESLVERAVRLALPAAQGEVSVALVDDEQIRQLNARYLGHDWPTDVLSFCLEAREGYVEGEIVCSAQTARRVAERLGCPPQQEALLYVVHGALHLAGYDDQTPQDRQAMRTREREILCALGLPPPADAA
jgi:probable rRNA maturation factor